MSNFLRNVWYAAATSQEVGDGLFSRVVIGTRVLLYRTTTGQPVALEDRCPHRFAPLSMGKREGDCVRCGYHGLTFDPSGNCVRNPFGEHIPPRATVRTFPVIERHRLLWIWPGDPAKADPASIPDFSFVESDATPIGHLSMQAHYELLTDNLMDLSHIEFVHTGTFGGGGVIFQGKHSVVEENGAVHSNWWMPDIAPPPWSRHQFADDARVDHWLDMRWNAPASMRLVVGVAPAGTPRSQVPVLQAAHIVTPETECSTHYFFSTIKRALQANGCRDATELVANLESISRPAPAVDTDTATAYERTARDGFQNYIDGDPEVAIKMLEKLVATLDGNPRVVVDYPNLRASHRLALVGLAMAHRKLAEKADADAITLENDARKHKRNQQKLAAVGAALEEAKAQGAGHVKQAREFMATLTRTFADRDIQRSEFGGDTFDFFEEVKRELSTEGKAELTFTLDDDSSGVIYVNGEYANVGKIDAIKVPQGPTTILVRWGSGPSTTARFYRGVLQNGPYVRRTERRFEQVLHTGPDWCCYAYPAIESRDQHLDRDIVPFSRNRSIEWSCSGSSTRGIAVRSPSSVRSTSRESRPRRTARGLRWNRCRPPTCVPSTECTGLARAIVPQRKAATATWPASWSPAGGHWPWPVGSRGTRWLRALMAPRGRFAIPTCKR